MIGMEEVTAESVDGRFAEDDVATREDRDREEAEIFARTWSHTTPSHGTGAA